MPTKNKTNKGPYAWALLRLSLGLTFLWPFFDKLFGLGFSTCRDTKTNAVDVLCSKAWLEGGSPTTGFLKSAAKGPFADFYHNLAGKGFIDWLFMAGLLLIGLALLVGVGVKIAAAAGSLLLFMMWTAALPPTNNPVLDDHIIYILALIGIALANSEQKWGLRSWWVKQSLAKRFPILE